MQGAWVQSPVRELRSHMPQLSTAKSINGTKTTCILYQMYDWSHLDDIQEQIIVICGTEDWTVVSSECRGRKTLSWKGFGENLQARWEKLFIFIWAASTQESYIKSYRAICVLYCIKYTYWSMKSTSIMYVIRRRKNKWAEMTKLDSAVGARLQLSPDNAVLTRHLVKCQSRPEWPLWSPPLALAGQSAKLPSSNSASCLHPSLGDWRELWWSRLSLDTAPPPPQLHYILLFLQGLPQACLSFCLPRPSAPTCFLSPQTLQ